MKYLIVLLACVMVGAYAQTPARGAIRIDGSTTESFHKSWQLLTASLTPSQQSQLNLAVLRIGLSDVNSAKDLAARPAAEQNITPDKIRSKVDGLTFAEILQLAERSPTKIVGVENPH